MKYKSRSNCSQKFYFKDEIFMILNEGLVEV